MPSWQERAFWECPEYFCEEDFSLAGSSLYYLLCLPSHVVSECCLHNIPVRKPIQMLQVALHKVLSSCLDGIIYILFFCNYAFFRFKHDSILECKCTNLDYLLFKEQSYILSLMKILDLGLLLIIWAALGKSLRFPGI